MVASFHQPARAKRRILATWTGAKSGASSMITRAAVGEVHDQQILGIDRPPVGRGRIGDHLGRLGRAGDRRRPPEGVARRGLGRLGHDGRGAGGEQGGGGNGGETAHENPLSVGSHQASANRRGQAARPDWTWRRNPPRLATIRQEASMKHAWLSLIAIGAWRLGRDRSGQAACGGD